MKSYISAVDHENGTVTICAGAADDWTTSAAPMFADPLAALEDMQRSLAEFLPHSYTEHPDPLCLRWCGFRCRGVCDTLEPRETRLPRRQTWGMAQVDDAQALEELKRQLGARVPVYVQEPHLRLGFMCWTAQSLPRVFLANDVYLRLQEATK